MGIRLVRADTDTLGTILLQEYQEALEAKHKAELAFLEQESRLLNYMGDRKSTKINNKKITVVRRETTRIDDSKLKKLLGATLYNKVTKKVLDRPKLESMISTGEINIDQVASASEIVPSKPYLRVSDVEEVEES